MSQTPTDSMPFGGAWTEKKLDCLAKYLRAYTTIFHGNPRARYFTTYYVDAFAGTGYVKTKTRRIRNRVSLFAEMRAPDTREYLEGSAIRALQTEPPFHRFLFIEKDPERCTELESLKTRFPAKAASIEIQNGEANVLLPRWFDSTDWDRTRAVLFLDPCAMEVKWSLIEQIAKTKAIDFWLLFPCMAFNRLLTTRGRPRESWARLLTEITGTDRWKEEFYSTNRQSTLFGEREVTRKQAGYEKIGRFVLDRLKEANFAGVARNPLLLSSSRGPLFLLCFAAANEKAAPTAIKIAQSIIEG